MKGNLFVDLTWLKGTARTIISNAIQYTAIANGWRWYSTNDIIKDLTDGFIVLTDDGHIESLPDVCSPEGRCANLHELSVNDALNGSYGMAEKRLYTKVPKTPNNYFNLGEDNGEA